MALAVTICRMRVRVSGTVQGVGFRPFVFRLAEQLALAGWVRNDERGVEAEIEGEREAVGAFLERLSTDAPPLARVEGVTAEPLAAWGERAFVIAPSVHAPNADAPVAADAATCSECLAELSDPGDRRFRYPFINCTNCGPRFTIVRGVPYDRPLTTMADFAMCAACTAEYEDPRDRRFHAQPNACPACGPRVRLVAGGSGIDVAAASKIGVAVGSEVGAAGSGMGVAVAGGNGIDPVAVGVASSDPIRATAQLIADGAILAIKGLGGFHLACRADDAAAVARLRARKRREERPFALMVADLDVASRFVLLEDEQAELLRSPARPIVLVTRRKDARVAQEVACRSPELGLMLPYTPLHHLLMADASELGVEALVMTSGNVSDEPIAYEDADAMARLAPIADALLVHDRPIHMRTDDSVIRAVRVREGCRPLMLRRSRGYVPAPLGLALPASRPMLACGAELKSTFCLARGGRAWVSHHIGDLKSYEVLRSFAEGVAHFEELFAVSPDAIVHDLHPDYLSTSYALERAVAIEVAEQTAARKLIGDRDMLAGSVEHARDGTVLIGVQHHHAHLAACLAEHGETGPAVGAVFDGSGYGADGAVWGGELLVGDLRDFERAGRLRAVRLPGGDRAVREPWRVACAWLGQVCADADGLPPLPGTLAASVSPDRWQTIARLARSELAPIATSAGRLFDAVAALCGVRASVSYEGQAAIELEGAVDHSEHGEYAIDLESRDGMLELDPRTAISEVAGERAAGVAIGRVAARFHSGFACATARACAQLASDRHLDTVVLSGGVFQNRVLLERTVAELEQSGLRVLLPERLPPGDGGISYGQAAVAAARLS
jgi:hydrogenase maturation protein HypF